MTSGGSFWNYNEVNMLNAADDVQRGIPLATAAKNHKVPRTTLRNYLVKGPHHFKKMGRKPVLHKSEEDILVLWIQSSAKAGFPVTSEELFTSVQKLLKDLHRENEFENDRPGRAWLAGFKKRNPSIATRVAQNLTVTRASVTEIQLHRWFDEVLSYLKDCQLEYILKEPQRIFNADESAFFLNPKGSKVLAPKGSKNVYQQVNSNEKECITVLICASADGVLGPPLVVFKYERIPNDLINSVPEGWGLGKSESGWMTCELFYEYITNVYYPWLVKNNVSRPVILFVDGHTSHLSLHTSTFCNENGIILVALFPNATHLIQPMDVAVFRSLKESWKNRVHEWRREHLDNPTLKKKDFSPLMKKVLDELPQSIISHGFRKCGLYPWDPASPSIPIQREVQPSVLKYNVDQLKLGLNILEQYIGPEKLTQFRSSSLPWVGCDRDQELFLVWRKMGQDISDEEPLAVPIIPLADVGDSGNIESPIVTEKDIFGHLESTSHDYLLDLTEDGIVIDSLLPEDTDIRLPASYVNNELNHHLDTRKPASNIPSPFKRSLFWPQQSTKAKKGRMKKELVPSVVTSDKWRELQLNKAKKKEETEKLRELRKLERLKKKLEKDALMKKKASERDAKKNASKIKVVKRKKICESSSSEEEESWNPSGNSSDDASMNLEEDELNFPSTSGSVVAIEPDPSLGDDRTLNELLPIDNDTPPHFFEESLNPHQIGVSPMISHLNERSKDEDEKVPQGMGQDIREGDFVIITFSDKHKKPYSRVCQVQDYSSNEQLSVQVLGARNRMRNVFVLNGNCVSVSKEQVIKKLIKPIVFGSKGNEILQFPFPIFL